MDTASARVPASRVARLPGSTMPRPRACTSCLFADSHTRVAESLSASFDDNVAAHARMRAESFTADLSAPAMLTLLPWFLLRSTRAYRYTMTCRARAGLPRARGLRTTLIMQMLEQLELPTHWLHPAAHHIRHAPQTRAQFHGQFSEIFTVVCGGPRHVPALTCLLVCQTNGMVQYVQLYWAAVDCAPTPAVPLMLPTARLAAPRPRDHDVIYTMVAGEPVRMPVLDSYGVHSAERGWITSSWNWYLWVGSSGWPTCPCRHGHPRCPALTLAQHTRARCARTRPPHS